MEGARVAAAAAAAQNATYAADRARASAQEALDVAKEARAMGPYVTRLSSMWQPASGVPSWMVSPDERDSGVSKTARRLQGAISMARVGSLNQLQPTLSGRMNSLKLISR